jgi:DNA-binding NarL/FixJ family response regulator
MNKIRILLADDQLLFVESLKTVLETRAKDFQVVGIAYNGEDAVKMAGELSPDVVLMDVRMPILDGVEAARIIHEKFPATQIMMLTTFDDDEYVRNALCYGAVGYLLKDAPPREVIAAVRAAKDGPVLISPAIAVKILQAASPSQTAPDGKETKKQEKCCKIYELSRREREVLELLSQGLNNKEIAGRLFLAEQTVKNILSAIYSKTGAHNRITALKIVMDS